MTTGTTSDVRVLAGEDDVAQAAAVAAGCHARLVEQAPFLPGRTADHYRDRLAWLTEHGVVLGLWQEGRLAAFLGGVRFGDFRHAGPGWFSPDWANGAVDPAAAFDDYRVLYREIAPRWLDADARIHAVQVLASAAPVIEALSLTGFGRIVMDAAAPTAEVAARSARGVGAAGAAGVVTRRATPDDAEAISAMEARLAEHIGASPIFFPDTRGDDADWWRAWLVRPTSVAVLAEVDGKTLGYLKAEDPQPDVADAVHDPSCLAINGMYCDPSVRGRGVGTALLSALAGHATAVGKSLMSVDCESHNLEAYGFWSRFFTPVAWSFERRV